MGTFLCSSGRMRKKFYKNIRERKIKLAWRRCVHPLCVIFQAYLEGSCWRRAWTPAVPQHLCSVLWAQGTCTRRSWSALILQWERWFLMRSDVELVRSLLTVCCPTRFRSSVTLMLPGRLQTSVWWLSHCVHQTSKQMVSDTDIRHSADSKCFGLLHRPFVSAFSLFSWNFISSRGRKKNFKMLRCCVTTC